MSAQDRRAYDALTRELRRAEARGDEAGRIADVRALGSVPEACGPAIPEAPARGPVRVFQTYALYPDADSGYVPKLAGYKGRKTMRRADAFDLMAAAFKRKGRTMPLTYAQVAFARDFAAAVERHACAGSGGASLEAGAGGCGDPDAFITALVQDGRWVSDTWARAEPGDGAPVLTMARKRRGDTRRTIRATDVIRLIVIAGKSVDNVLDAHGWASDARTRRAIYDGLSAALDRMRCERPRRELVRWVDVSAADDPCRVEARINAQPGQPLDYFYRHKPREHPCYLDLWIPGPSPLMKKGG